MIEIEAWAARGEDGMLYLYRDKPKKGDKQWYSNSLTCTGLIFLSDEMSPEVQWSDGEPTRVKVTIEK